MGRDVDGLEVADVDGKGPAATVLRGAVEEAGGGVEDLDTDLDDAEEEDEDADLEGAEDEAEEMGSDGFGIMV